MSKSLELVWIEQEPVRVFSTAHFQSAAAPSGPNRFTASRSAGASQDTSCSGTPSVRFRIQLSSDSHDDNSRAGAKRFERHSV